MKRDFTIRTALSISEISGYLIIKPAAAVDVYALASDCNSSVVSKGNEAKTTTVLNLKYNNVS